MYKPIMLKFCHHHDGTLFTQLRVSVMHEDEIVGCTTIKNVMHVHQC